MSLSFTHDELNEAVRNGRVTRRAHPTLPLFIFNYSPEVQYSNKWDEVTLTCRGLILDADYNVVARPWKKFFNLGQVNLPIQFDMPVEVMDKADGSLGILYPVEDGFAVATRGSFESKQAVDATKIWNESYANTVVPDGYTFLFEILLPWNRIVLEYKYDSEYLQQGRGILPQRSARNDSREYLHSAEERLEDLSRLQERGPTQGQAEAFGQEDREYEEVAQGERGAFSGTVYADLQEDSGEDSRGEEGQALYGLRADISSGLHGLRPSTGNGQEIQHRGGAEPTSLGRGNGEVRTGMRELSQDSHMDYTPGNLVLLGAVDNRNGYYHGPREAAAYLGWDGPVVDVMEFTTLSDALANMGRKNAEGYVIRSHNFLVKVKEPDYVELHRLVTNASPKTVWEQLKAGKSKSEVISAFPDEFHSYIEGMVDPLLEQFEERYGEIMDRFVQSLELYREDYGSDFDRGRYARRIKYDKDKRYFFLLLDNRPIRDVLWAELKPKESPLRLEAD